MMTCREVRRHLARWATGARAAEDAVRVGAPVRDRAGAPLGPEREAMAAHLASCPKCEQKARLLALRHLLLSATRAEEGEPAPSFYSRVSARVRELVSAPGISFWEAVRAFSASMALVAGVLLLLGMGLYVQWSRGTRGDEAQDFLSALMERNLSESERMVLAGGEELNLEGVVLALGEETRGTR